MADKLVNVISSVGGLDINETRLHHEYNRIVTALAPALDTGKPDSVILFGLSGVGKTALGKAISLWVNTKGNLGGAVQINCRVAMSIDLSSELKDDEPNNESVIENKSIINQILGDGGALVIDRPEVLEPGACGSAAPWVHSIISEALNSSRPIVVIGTSTLPGAICPTIRSSFGKAFYVPPEEINELGRWLELSGFPYETSQAAAEHVKKAYARWDINSFAAHRLLVRLSEIVKTGLVTLSADASVLAHFLLTGCSEVFIDGTQRRNYERDHDLFVSKSSLLETVLRE